MRVPTVRILIAMPREYRDKLRLLAKRNDRSVSEMVRRALAAYFALTRVDGERLQPPHTGVPELLEKAKKGE